MNPQMIVFLLPYVIVGGISCGYIIYALRQRHRAGALPFAWMVFLEALWMVTLARDRLAPYHAILRIPQFWETVQIVILAGWALACLVFAWQYTRSTARHATFWGILAGTLTVIVAGLAILPRWPELFRPVSAYLPEQFMTMSLSGISLVNWPIIVWAGGLGLASLILLLRRCFYPGSLSSVRLSFILIGLATLIAGISAARLNVSVPFYTGDPTPLAIVVSQLIMAWSIFCPRRIQLVPAARETMLEHAADLMLIIDDKGRIADLNPAALALLASLPGANENQTICDLLKKPFEQVFSDLSELREYVQRGEKGPLELVIAMPEGPPCYFSVTLTPLHNHQGRLLGQLVVAHDITLRKQLEKDLHAAETRLEQTTTTLQQTEQTLHTTEDRLQQTTARLHENEAVLSATEIQLQQTAGKLQETEVALHTTETQLQQTEATLNSTATQLQETTATLQRTEQTLSARETELHQTQETLQHSEQARQAIETSLRERESELRQVGESLQAKENALIEAQRARQDYETRVRQAHEALHTSETTCQALKEALQNAEHAIKTAEEAQKQAAAQTIQALPNTPVPPRAKTSPTQDKQPNLPKGKRLSNAQVQKHLADLPPEDLRALKGAAAQLNPFKIARVIEPLWAHDAALADALQAFAQQHNYRQLSDLIEKAQTALLESQ